MLKWHDTSSFTEVGLAHKGPISTLVSAIAHVKAFIAINQVAALSDVSWLCFNACAKYARWAALLKICATTLCVETSACHLNMSQA